MNAKVFSDAVGVINSNYIDEAAIYQRVKNIPWAEHAAAAACLMFVAAIIIPTISKQNQNSITDIKPKGN